jgi:hypothetical protein
MLANLTGQVLVQEAQGMCIQMHGPQHIVLLLLELHLLLA